jgi:hypothetical protein
MKYFIDTEFIEGKQDTTIPWLILKKRGGGLSIGQPKPTIDLISIGIVAEDSREYYAISKEFNIKEAWNRFQLKEWTANPIGKQEYIKEYWIRNNVLKPIFYELMNKDIRFHNIDKQFTYKNFKKLITKYGKSNKQIATEIIEFCKPIAKHIVGKEIGICEGSFKTITVAKEYGDLIYEERNAPEFYGYYSDYDWVVFCWLFGNMIDLPSGFPMYCNDLKQTLDERILSGCIIKHRYADFSERDISMDRGNTFDEVFRIIKEQPNYPKQTNEHNALADAKWNYELYKFLQTL